MKVRLVTIYNIIISAICLFGLLAAGFCDALTDQRVTGIIDQIKSDIDATGAPKIDPDMLRRANEAIAHTRKKKFMGEVEKYKESIAKQFGQSPPGGENQGDDEKKESGSPHQLSESERIYVFISGSMPKSLLRSYAAEIGLLEDPNVVMVLRGLVGKGKGRIAQTMGFVSDILTVDEHCDTLKNQCEYFKTLMQIDPLMFTKFGIDSVPAVAYLENLTVEDSELSVGLDGNARGENAYIVNGAVSLRYAIKKVNEKLGKEKLKAVITKLEQRGFYGKK